LAGGTDSDAFIIHNLPLYLTDTACTWLEHLSPNEIRCWADLKEIFVGNFQGTYVHLKNCRQKPDEILCEYIHRFSWHCNELPNVADINVIGAFLSVTTCESLVHKLGRKHPRTTKELLDIATSHASGEEAVGAIFDHARGKAKQDEDASEGTSNRLNKKKRSKLWSGDLLVAAAERKGKRASTEGALDHFEKMLKGPCPNHAYPIKHAYKDYRLMKKFLSRGPNKGDRKKKPDLPRDDTEEEDTFSEEISCLMIFGGPAMYDSKCR
jgi:hypothetical protein